jgi:hypothetical protein
MRTTKRNREGGARPIAPPDCLTNSHLVANVAIMETGRADLHARHCLFHSIKAEVFISLLQVRLFIRFYHELMKYHNIGIRQIFNRLQA